MRHAFKDSTGGQQTCVKCGKSWHPHHITIHVLNEECRGPAPSMIDGNSDALRDDVFVCIECFNKRSGTKSADAGALREVLRAIDEMRDAIDSLRTGVTQLREALKR
jgi:hypothetical protein